MTDTSTQSSEQLYQLYVYIPETHLEIVKEALFAAGAGRYEQYDSCCWQSKGEGQFRPLRGSQPAIGTIEQLEKVTEYKVELICRESCLAAAIAALHSAHPYEEPAFGMLKLSQ